jgi:hypothetical protein
MYRHGAGAGGSALALRRFNFVGGGGVGTAMGEPGKPFHANVLAVKCVLGVGWFVLLGVLCFVRERVRGPVKEVGGAEGIFTGAAWGCVRCV